MKKVVEISHKGLEAAISIEPVEIPDQTGVLSLFRDGTVLSPVDFFEPIDVMEL